METDKKNSDKTELRRRAEKKFEMEARDTKELAEMSPEKMSNLIHDLQVHQIELKMQNDELRRIHKELEESRDRYSHLYDFAPDGYFTLTEKGLIDGANLTLASMLGIVRADLLGESFNRFVQKEDQDIFYKHRQKIMETEIPHTCELHLVKKDGHEIYVRLEAIVIQNEKGPKQIRVAVSDITELRRSEKDLLRSEAKYSSMDEAHEFAENIINTVREPLIVLDQDLRVVSVSRSFYDFFRVKPEETMGQFIYDLGNKQWDIPTLRELLETILPEKASFNNYEVEHDFDTIGNRTMLLNARQIERVMGKERIILLAIEDITERKQYEEKIQHMAFHDSLTGLPNRKLFSDRLGIALAQAKRNNKILGIVMLDLDNFKDVNDTLGHDVGDILLKAVAERLSGTLRKSDTVARFGGDEFVLIFPDMDVIEEAIQVVQKIIDRFHKPFLIDTHQLVVTTSIGITVYPNDGMDEEILIKKADIAMYQAKQAGRARYQLYRKT